MGTKLNAFDVSPLPKARGGTIRKGALVLDCTRGAASRGGGKILDVGIVTSLELGSDPAGYWVFWASKKHAHVFFSQPRRVYDPVNRVVYDMEVFVLCQAPSGEKR